MVISVRDGDTGDFRACISSQGPILAQTIISSQWLNKYLFKSLSKNLSKNRLFKHLSNNLSNN